MTLRYKFLEIVFQALSRFIKRRPDHEIEGIGNLPPKGTGYIAAANHRSFIDGLILPQVLVTARKEGVHMVSYKYLFSIKFVRVVLWWAEGLVLDPGSKEGIARFFEDAKHALLVKHECVGMHPEAHISRTGEFGKARPGAALLSLETGCPVVPIGLIGTALIMPPGTMKLHLVRRAISMKIGKPMYFHEYKNAYDRAVEEGNEKVKREILLGCITKVMHEIAKLTGQTYRHGSRWLARLGKYEERV